jgi:hypothetical protein
MKIKFLIILLSLIFCSEAKDSTVIHYNIITKVISINATKHYIKVEGSKKLGEIEGYSGALIRAGDLVTVTELITDREVWVESIKIRGMNFSITWQPEKSIKQKKLANK